MRLQLALNVDDLDQAVAFYSKLFDTEPAKRKPGYANFAIENPPLKLVLFEVKGAAERLNHLGVEVFEAEEVTPGASPRRRQSVDTSLVLSPASLDVALAGVDLTSPIRRRDDRGVRGQNLSDLVDRAQESRDRRHVDLGGRF